MARISAVLRDKRPDWRTTASTEKDPSQRVRYLCTRDDVQVAWAEAGSGPLLVKAANWLCHLEREWESPVWAHWYHFFARHTRFARYDMRGCGMSERDVADVSHARWIDDLDDVVNEIAEPDEPVALFGASHGSAACLSYAVRHPERVSHLILYGCYARGFMHRQDPVAEREHRAVGDLFELGWVKDNPFFHQVFTSRFIPGGSPEQLAWFNDFCRKAAAPSMANRLRRMCGALNVVDLLEQVRVPTLVIHAREDAVVPLAESRLIASRIPDAQFIELESRNHILLEHEPAWARFREVVLDFLGTSAAVESEDAVFASLSPRERDVLALISEGLANVEIGERLAISEKTVRNHISKVFDKLGVWTRAQAMVFARDHGFTQ